MARTDLTMLRSTHALFPIASIMICHSVSIGIISGVYNTRYSSLMSPHSAT